jgi:HEPN domain-containing protein
MATDDANYWIDLARYDLGAAKSMLKSRHRLYAGFLCQLAIEKTLKAYWAGTKKNTPPYIHDLAILSQRTNLLDQMDQQCLAILDFLRPFHIEGRYPTERTRLLRKLTPAKCVWMMKETERLHKWIRSRLSSA